jgi:hypothetical protein
MPASWAGVVRPVVVDGSCQPSLANKILKGPAKFLGSLAVSSFRRSDNDQARLFDWHWEFHNPSASMTSRPGIRKKCPGRARRYERPPSGSDQALDKRAHRSRRRIVQTILLQEHCLFTVQPASAGDCKMPERFALRKTWLLWPHRDRVASHVGPQAAAKSSCASFQAPQSGDGAKRAATITRANDCDCDRECGEPKPPR